MKKLSQIQFIEYANKRFNNKFDYSLVKYAGLHKKVKIICPRHGEFQQRPSSHLYTTSQGCRECGYIERKMYKGNTQQFIQQAQKTHGNKYDYSKSTYVDVCTKIEIICLTCGPFFPTPNDHISKKSGCPKCAVRNRDRARIYNIDKFPELVICPAKIYVIHMQHKNENFIKVGITKNNVKIRYAGTNVSDKYVNKEILIEKTLPLVDAFNLEQKILITLKIIDIFLHLYLKVELNA